MRTHFAAEDRPTAAEAYAAFISREMTERRYRTETQRSYSHAIREYLQLSPDRPYADQLDLASVERYAHALEQRGLLGTARHVKVAAVKAFISYLEEQHLLPSPFASAILLPAGERTRPRRVEDDQLSALLAAAEHQPRDRAILMLLLRTGISLGELIELTLDDLTLPPIRKSRLNGTGEGVSCVRRATATTTSDSAEAGRLRVRGRRDQVREVALDNAICRVLANYAQVRPSTPDRHLFLTKYATPLTIQSAGVAIKRCARLAGIRGANAKALRTTSIAQQLASGTPLDEVQLRVGHARSATTRRYADPLRGLESGTSADAPAEHHAAENQQGAKQMQSCRVLIIEEHASARADLRRHLHTAGFDVYEAPDEVIARDMLRLAGQPLVVLLQVSASLAGGDRLSLLRDVLESKRAGEQILPAHGLVVVRAKGCQIPDSMADLITARAMATLVAGTDSDALLTALVPLLEYAGATLRQQTNAPDAPAMRATTEP
jgi:site-specific recombinase XerD